MNPRTAILALLVVGCAPNAQAPASPGDTPGPSAAAPAPWAGEPLRDAPAVFTAEWRRAANRGTCRPLAPATLGAGEGATPRAATYSGGWAVAYDLPGRRSAFGIAGSGSRATDPAYSSWPHAIAWDDGSRAEYGPEGGTGPNQLAYLRVRGQDCLYNVWSRLGVEHLELLLGQLRWVRVES